jgi:hypothetical protein
VNADSAVNRDEALQRFDSFLMLMGEQLRALEGDAARLGLPLAPGPDTPEQLEALFDALAYGLSREADTEAWGSLLVYIARYLGEWVRQSFGGRWVLPLDDARNVNFNTPVIVGHSPVPGLDLAPLSLVRAYGLRRRRGTLRGGVLAQVRPDPPLDLSDLAEGG